MVVSVCRYRPVAWGQLSEKGHENSYCWSSGKLFQFRYPAKALKLGCQGSFMYGVIDRRDGSFMLAYLAIFLPSRVTLLRQCCLASGGTSKCNSVAWCVALLRALSASKVACSHIKKPALASAEVDDLRARI